MPKVRGNYAQKWKDRASTATEIYVEGVQNPRVDWATATQQAESNYNAGVQAAISKKAFGKGVRLAGSSKQIRGAVEKGSQRFSQGVQLGEGAYQSGIDPYIKATESTTLPPRGPKGDPKNLIRVQKMNEVMMKKKSELRG